VRLGYILLALSLGTIIGPLLSGILSNSEWGSWFHVTTPLYAAALLSLLNLIYLYYRFQEAYTPTNNPIIQKMQSLRIIMIKKYGMCHII
jgi:MFS family permease